MSNKPLVAAALGYKPSRQPVWFLRQAGRYLPEYMQVRKNVEFTELCRTPDLAAEVTLQPLRRFDLDAAIIFSDILVPCMPMGQQLTFGKGHGPQLDPPIRSAADLAKLKRTDVAKELAYVGEAIVRTKEKLRPEQTMIGFAGAPFTVASYMIEGAGSKTYTEVKRLRYEDEGTFKGLLDALKEVTIEYLLMQVQAGADCLMLFDSWANQMQASDYRSLVFPPLNDIVAEIKAKTDVPVIYYPGQGTDLYFELGGYKGDVIAVDWRTRMQRAIRLLHNEGLQVTVQGNLDPQALLAPEDVLREQVRGILAEGKAARGHIFNVGHGLQPHLDPEKVGIVVDEIRRAESASS